MSVISDYSDQVNEQFASISTSVDEIVESQTGIDADVKSLKDIILKLQSNSGPISPEDQKLLDTGVETVKALASKTAAVSKALKELDAATETPPEAPQT
jgi:peptidoglycan hydrolase CwlO-like protein